MKKYELLEHTADIKIRVTAADLKSLFKNSALAMFDIMAEKKTKEKSLHNPPFCKGGKRGDFRIKQEADNLDELFVNWLNELLSLSATKELIFSKFQINKINTKTLQAVAIGEEMKNYKVNTEIKAATYHELKIEEREGLWQAEVIFDV